MTGLLGYGGELLARYLSGTAHSVTGGVPTDPILLCDALRPGDVLLVEGRSRISTAIKYLTQSTWSHAALCVTAYEPATAKLPQFVEADAVAGVRRVHLSQFADFNTRICRPVGLDDANIAAVTDYAKARLGDGYDLTNVFDLARYLFPTPPVPIGWRRRMLALGSGDPTRAICSTLIALAFQSIRYPILPTITREMTLDPDCNDCLRDILHIRHHSLFTPRDFDMSPYFEIIKPALTTGFDHHGLAWADSAA
jgi:hypothetical protein